MPFTFDLGASSLPYLTYPCRHYPLIYLAPRKGRQDGCSVRQYGVRFLVFHHGSPSLRVGVCTSARTVRPADRRSSLGVIPPPSCLVNWEVNDESMHHPQGRSRFRTQAVTATRREAKGYGVRVPVLHLLSPVFFRVGVGRGACGLVVSSLSCCFVVPYGSKVRSSVRGRL